MVEFSKKDARLIAKGLKIAITQAMSDGFVVMGCDALEYSRPNHLLANVTIHCASGSNDKVEYVIDLLKSVATLH